MLLRCSALQQVGFFDERYFAYVEDVDITLRAWILGYQAFLAPSAVIYHHGAVSSSQRQQIFWGYRNQLTTLLKLYEPASLRSFKAAICRRWLLTRNYAALRGTISAMTMLAGTLRRRRNIQTHRTRADREIWDLVPTRRVATDH